MSEGGYLAIVNSNQELNYLLQNVRRGNTWFGGIDKVHSIVFFICGPAFTNFSQSFSMEQTVVQQRVKRQSQDDDLLALAEAFSAFPLSEELRRTIESFEPDWQGLSRKEINRLDQNQKKNFRNM